MSIESTISNFVRQQALPSSYRLSAEKYFLPLAAKLAKQCSSRNTPLLVGIHGCQGSGKSTLTDFLVYVLKHEFHLSAVGMSIDDFYKTKDERAQLANTKHPLFATRGVPGTHDTHLLTQVLSSFQNNTYPITIPRFDKSVDDRYPSTHSAVIEAKPSIVLLEGWCVGSVPCSSDSLKQPINSLESKEDGDAIWRSYSNDQLAGEYGQIFSMLEVMIMLKAPGFYTVKQWRHEQELRLKEKLIAQGLDTHQLMDEASIERFIQHYERITSHSLETIPAFADDVFELDENRMIHNHIERGRP